MGLFLQGEIVSLVCSEQFSFFMLVLFQGPPLIPTWAFMSLTDLWGKALKGRGVSAVSRNIFLLT